jgi:hypothetical protein
MRILETVVVLLAMSILALAANIASGDWTAVIKVKDTDLRLALHVTESDKGLQATFDSVDQKVFGMPVDKIERKGQQLRFETASIQAVYSGTLTNAGTMITDAWLQLGQSFSLNFRKTRATKK